MKTKASMAAMVCALWIGAWGQQPQQGTAAKQQQPSNATRQTTSNGASQANAGTVRNDRQAAMPRVGVNANWNTANELVGCIEKQGQGFVLDQPQLDRRYQLRGSNVADNAGMLVRVTGRLVFGHPAGFDVQQIDVIQPRCDYAATSSWRPATGGTGPEGSAFNVTSTATVGQATPAYQTELGVKQNPGMAEGAQNVGAYSSARPHHTEAQGAPADPRTENPMEAERIAISASRSEMQNAQQLGVNAQPNYAAESNPQQTQQLAQGQAQQWRGQATESARVLQGGAGTNAAGGNEQQAAGNTAPVFTGCITLRKNQLMLVESATGEQFRIDAGGSNAGQFVNQQVRVVGDTTGTYGPAVGSAGSNATVHVRAIRAIGPCNSR